MGRVEGWPEIGKSGPTPEGMHKLKDQVDALKRACDALSMQDLATAEAIISSEIPFEPTAKQSRRYTETEATHLFLRDGFIDRYSGDRLIYPPVLRLVSLMLPSVFPYQSNWKLDQCHIAFWKLSPTVDHMVPVARGGLDKPQNWVTTSMFRNSAKSNWLLEEIGWSLHPRGNLSDWDGMFSWFLSYVAASPDVLKNSLVKRWHSAATNAHDKLNT